MDISSALQPQTGKHNLPGFHVAEFADLHNDGILASCLLSALLLVWFLTSIKTKLKKCDERIATLKQHSADEEHIMRLSLLAAGSIHELGTPLTAISVILKDIQSLPLPGCEAAFTEDINAMQREVERCRAIISGILRSSGEGAEMVSLQQFMDSAAAAWKGFRQPAVFDYKYHAGDTRIVPDALIRQMLFILLDNAFEASPQWVGLEVSDGEGVIVIRVADHGKGFSEEALEAFGKPYASGKDGHGHGLGLFLTVNLLRRFGGQAIAANTANGAKVTATIPLGAIGAKKSD